ncbi:hypothetical protein [Streptomyces swartbergensis]|uniref:Lipoprotein n=1 Tax=Streptomyces swartbergensis TaxID=487165 RepID=A0A243RXP0_9ACTN|nr:hypothetical protein [Streptomyces swartbergensis]OUC99956.1 hypothetical protein CA983_27400 [Streptomyces swartbergensis]
MRAICVASASAVLLGAGTLTSCVPADAAVQTDFGFSVEPSTVAAGGQVTLRVQRNEACQGEAVVSSPVFDMLDIPWHQSSATARVDRDAKPGAVYSVVFICDESSGTAHLTIAGGRPPHHPPQHPSDHHRHPSKGVHAGEGGTLAAFDLKEIGLGAALIAGALGTAYHFARRRTDEDAG